MCCSAASNAANSPLLRLPPEVRCRIYDYAFGSCVVHVNVGYKGSRHTLTNCSSPQKCEAPLLQRRIQRIIKSSYPYNATWWHLEVCRKPSNRQVTCKIPVHMMQVCRQIYHEVALKPFAEASFHVIIPDRHCRSEMKLFLATLVPTHARAIAHLRFSLIEDQFLSGTIAKHLTGLKHVEIHTITYYDYPYQPDQPLHGLQAFGDGKGFKALKELDLKSLRLTVGIDDRRPPTEHLKAAVLEWMGRFEVGVTHDVPPEQPW